MKTLSVTPLRRSDQTTRCAVADYMTRHVAPRIGLFYPARLEAGLLAQSLARVLSDFSTFAGKLAVRDSGLWIEPSAGGVPLEVTESSSSLAELAKAAPATRGAQLAPLISTGRALRGQAPLMGARLTHTPDGSVLGFSWHHPVGDFHTAMLLLRCWALAYRNRPYEKPLEVPDRDAYMGAHVQDAPGAESALHVMSATEVMRFMLALSRRYRPVQLEFGREELTELQTALSRDRRITVDDALWAQIAVAMRSLRGPDASAELLMALNLRWQLRLPLTLVGNIMGYLRQPIAPRDDAATIAAALRTQIEQYRARSVSHHATMRFAAAHARRRQRELYNANGYQPYRGDLLFVSSVVNFPYYDLCFEPEAPSSVFGQPAEKPLFTGTAIETPARGAEPSGRRVTIWLPGKLARQLDGERGRALVLSATAPLPTRTAPDRSLQPAAQ